MAALTIIMTIIAGIIIAKIEMQGHSKNGKLKYDRMDQEFLIRLLLTSLDDDQLAELDKITNG